jgi:hypothetical protein
MPREMTFGTNLVNDVAGGVGTAAFYILSFWRIFKTNPEDRSIQCGAVTIIMFVVMLVLVKIPNFPEWIFAALAILMFALCLLTLFLFAQDGYRALRHCKKRN